MWSEKAIYKIPQLKYILFVLSSSGSPVESKLSSGSKKRIEWIEDILHNRGNKIPTENRQWKAKIIPEVDFLAALNSQKSTQPLYPIHTFQNSEDMELLAINLVPQHPDPEDLTFTSPKRLSSVPKNDLIEVFI